MFTHHFKELLDLYIEDNQKLEKELTRLRDELYLSEKENQKLREKVENYENKTGEVSGGTGTTDRSDAGETKLSY